VRHHWVDGAASIEDDDLAHACSDCGSYCCGIHTLDGGRCPDCGDAAEAREVLASGQEQSAIECEACGRAMEQRTRVTLGEGAALIEGEVLCPGCAELLLKDEEE